VAEALRARLFLRVLQEKYFGGLKLTIRCFAVVFKGCFEKTWCFVMVN
jgi:hypothetical protein